MEQSSQQAGWAGTVPGATLPGLSFTISRGKRGGWVVWNAADGDAPTAYCTTLAEAWKIATEMAMEVGSHFNELPFVPQQPQQYLAPPQQQASTYRAPPQPATNADMPSFINPGAATSESLADQIASVQRGNAKTNGRYASAMMAAIALSLFFRPFLGV